MAWTQTDVDTLEAAIATAELTVRFADREVTYRSVAEMLKARDAIKSSIQGASGTTRCTYGQFSKG